MCWAIMYSRKGSLVSDKVLRFDFSHFSKVEAEQITEIERIVNERVRGNVNLDEKRNVPVKEAKALGAMAPLVKSMVILFV